MAVSVGGLKAISALVIFLEATIGLTLPYVMKTTTGLSSVWFVLFSCLSTGVFLATIFAHSLPELEHLSSLTDFPLDFVIAGLTYIVLYSIDAVTHVLGDKTGLHIHNHHDHDHYHAENDDHEHGEAKHAGSVACHDDANCCHDHDHDDHSSDHGDPSCVICSTIEHNHELAGAVCELCEHIAVAHSLNDNSEFTNDNHDVDTTGADARQPSLAHCITFAAAIGVHSMFEGLAIGAATADITPLLIAVCAHKWCDAAVVAIETLKLNLPKYKVFAIFATIALASPLGIGLGAALHAAVTGEAGEVVAAVAAALTAGTFLYVGLVEMLPTIFGRKWPFWRALVTVIGAVGMMVLLRLTHNHDHDHDHDHDH